MRMKKGGSLKRLSKNLSRNNDDAAIGIAWRSKNGGGGGFDRISMLKMVSAQ
jgi:hypothetical protein